MELDSTPPPPKVSMKTRHLRANRPSAESHHRHGHHDPHHRHGYHALNSHAEKKAYAYTRNIQWERLEKTNGIVTDTHVVNLVNKLQVDWQKLPTLSRVKQAVEDGKDVMAAQMSHGNFKDLMGPTSNLYELTSPQPGNPFRMDKEDCGDSYPHCGIVEYELRKVLYLEAGLDMMRGLREMPLEVQSVAAPDANVSSGWVLRHMDDASLSLNEDALHVEPAEHARNLVSVRIEIKDMTAIGPSGPKAVPDDFRSHKHKIAKVSFGDKVMVIVFRTGYERQAFIAGLKRLKDPNTF